MTLAPIPKEFLFDYQGACWWCGAKADSREHKWKKSEVTALYGSANSENYPLFWVDDSGGTKEIQGPNSSLLKFEKSLCQNCNSARSQPFDHAYDQWIHYLVANYDQIIESRIIDFRNVVETGYEDFKLNLAKYYAKHIGCKVADGAGVVPASLIAFLNGDSFDTQFVWAEFCINRLALKNHEITRHRLGSSQTVANASTKSRKLTSLKGALMHGAFQIVWDINLDPERPDSGNGLLQQDIYHLRDIDEDLYSHRFTIAQ
jgi:hypothetical protein